MVRIAEPRLRSLTETLCPEASVTKLFHRNEGKDLVRINIGGVQTRRRMLPALAVDRFKTYVIAITRVPGRECKPAEGGG